MATRRPARPRAAGDRARRRPAGDPREAQRAVGSLRPHEHSLLVPGMPRDEYEALRDDIAARGITTPLEVTATGVVLDGRERLRAARELGLEQVPARVVAPEDEVDYIVGAALRRRHLSASQRAALVVDYSQYRLVGAQARERRLTNLRRDPEVATLPPRGERTRELGAHWAGVGARTVQDAATVREADPALFQAIKDGTVPASRAAREVRRARRYAELEAAPELPTGSFEVIYADPPWQLGNPQAAYAPENYYPTMALEEITALKVPAAPDACLFLWAVNSLLPEALEVMAAWGFAYRTDFCWDKRSIGLGVWARNRHELLLFGICGRFSPPEPKDRRDSIIEAPRRRHSEKPIAAYEWIERMYPRASKLELFARGRPRPGWAAWGNEVEAA